MVSYVKALKIGILLIALYECGNWSLALREEH
jgi:hypothetical protein